jgi:hypothetical protein
MKMHIALLSVAGVLLSGTSASFADTPLKGTFNSDNEASLIKQLGPLGFVECYGYQRNPDGSVVITGMEKKGTAEPLVTVMVSKNGSATVIENEEIDKVLGLAK